MEYENQNCVLPITVKGDGPCLLGRNWLYNLRLNWKAMMINRVEVHIRMESLLERYNEIFQEELGAIKTFKLIYN